MQLLDLSKAKLVKAAFRVAAAARALTLYKDRLDNPRKSVRAAKAESRLELLD
jgi:hypothetical protein